jgi:hypothetical protein
MSGKMRKFWNNLKVLFWIFVSVWFLSWSAEVIGQGKTIEEDFQKNNKDNTLKVEINNLPPMLYQEVR